MRRTLTLIQFFAIIPLFCLNINPVHHYTMADSYISWNSIQYDENTYISQYGKQLNVVSLNGFNVESITEAYTEIDNIGFELVENKLYCATLSGGLVAYELVGSQLVEVDYYHVALDALTGYENLFLKMSHNYAFVVSSIYSNDMFQDILYIYDITNGITLICDEIFYTESIVGICFDEENYYLIFADGELRKNSFNSISEPNYIYLNLENISQNGIILTEQKDGKLYTITSNGIMSDVNQYNISENFSYEATVQVYCSIPLINSTILNDELVLNYFSFYGNSALGILDINDTISYSNTQYYSHYINGLHNYDNKYLVLEESAIEILDENFELETTLKEYFEAMHLEGTYSDQYVVLSGIYSNELQILDLVTGISEPISTNYFFIKPRSNYEQNRLQFYNDNNVITYQLNENEVLEQSILSLPLPGYDYSRYENNILIRTSEYDYNFYILENNEFYLITTFNVDFECNGPTFVDENHFVILKNLWEGCEFHYYKITNEYEVELLEVFQVSSPTIYVTENHILCDSEYGLIINIFDRDNPVIQGNLEFDMLDAHCEITYNGNGKYLFSGNFQQIITDENYELLDWWYENTNSEFVDESRILVGRRGHLALLEVEEFADSEDVQIPTPSQYSLTNHPNPFKLAGASRSPGTTISFKLADFGDQESALVEIYNIKGQRIKQLVSNSVNQLSEGEHSVVWDGTDNQNKPVSSGVYFYTLKLGDRVVASKKMLLLK